MNLGRRKTGSEYTSHIKKFLSQANDPLRRLKSLRSGLGRLRIIRQYLNCCYVSRQGLCA